MKREEILNTAACIVTGERYGRPEDNFEAVARLWGAYTGHEFTAVDVAAMMILLKLARVSSGHAKTDNWIDIAGYAACGGAIDVD